MNLILFRWHWHDIMWLKTHQCLSFSLPGRHSEVFRGQEGQSENLLGLLTSQDCWTLFLTVLLQSCSTNAYFFIRCKAQSLSWCCTTQLEGWDAWISLCLFPFLFYSQKSEILDCIPVLYKSFKTVMGGTLKLSNESQSDEVILEFTDI